jgi:ABC-type transporter Mla subunit MlaD
MYIFMLFDINIYMSAYSTRFYKILEQDEELTDAEALDSQLQDITSDELGADIPEGGTSTIATQQKEMYDELSEWINRMDEFSNYLNGTTDSIQTSLNSAEADTIFDSISNSETKKIARVAMEVSSLSEILKGYLAGANDPKYRFN